MYSNEYPKCILVSALLWSIPLCDFIPFHFFLWFLFLGWASNQSCVHAHRIQRYELPSLDIQFVHIVDVFILIISAEYENPIAKWMKAKPTAWYIDRIWYLQMKYINILIKNELTKHS